MNLFQPLCSSRITSLQGSVRIPGDKSMSHRALMLALLCKEETMISGLLEGEDVFNTAQAVKKLGAKISGTQDGLWRVFGIGANSCLHEPDAVLDMGNSGTSTRLLLGLIAGYPVTATMTGDASLIKRPMKRVMAPLEMMGAQFLCREDGKLPLTIRGANAISAIEYKMPVASAQVKSAILLAGLRANGVTTVIEPTPTRDHTENMLRHFGVEVTTEKLENGAHAIHLQGQQLLRGCAIDIPADPSSAAFPIVAALLIEGSEIRLPRIGVNPYRIGLYQTLKEMGAAIIFANERMESGELVADITVKGTNPLNGIEVPPERVPSMIDEFPILAVAAACARGKSIFRGLSELRVKESDRLAKIAQGLAACGVSVEEGQDSLIIHGTGKPPKGGAMIDTALDHRIAMSFLVMGCLTQEPIGIDDASPINTSFPSFAVLMNRLGADIAPSDWEPLP